MIIITLRMKAKELESDIIKKDFLSIEKLIEAIKREKSLNHLFLIHPKDNKSLKKLLEILKNKLNYFIICLSTDLDILKNIKQKENIWIISYAITTPTNFEIKEKFNNFYTEISKVKSAKDIDEIQTLIIKYLDPTHKLTPQIEQDLAYIYLWKSMSKDNITWTTLSRFENDNERIKKIEYFLRKLS